MEQVWWMFHPARDQHSFIYLLVETAQLHLVSMHIKFKQDSLSNTTFFLFWLQPKNKSDQWSD